MTYVFIVHIYTLFISYTTHRFLKAMSLVTLMQAAVMLIRMEVLVFVLALGRQILTIITNVSINKYLNENYRQINTSNHFFIRINHTLDLYTK
jgi:hypothetical protein